MEILEKIYPSPKNVKLLGGSVKLSGVRNETGDGLVLDSFLYSAEELCLSASEVGNIFLVKNKEIESDEGYSILAKDGGVRISAKSRQGFVYAAGTLSQLADDGGIPCIELYDEPLCKIRGVHMYLPPSDAIEEFLRVLDLLARLKYNTVFLEIGGGVEYESHPEINVAWKRFCREAREYYGGPQGLQASEAHWKDSTHVELAGGGCLTKDELLKIASHIRLLGMELIPEIQGLSHAYYLTLSHPEIAEQSFEPYPDTWCPLNETSYQLYEDIAKELHELLSFERVSIGHDEIRILGKCKKCKGKSASELVAYDLNRLHRIYEKMGVKIFMWGESLQNYVNSSGRRVGEKIHSDGKYGRLWEMGETHDAIDMIPRDITMLDWRWEQSIYSTSEFSERGISYIYGNFHGPNITHWQTLVKNRGFLGAEVSTWCVSDFNEIGRNGWFYDFVFSAAVLWERGYDDEKRQLFALRSNDYMPRLRAFLKKGEAAPYLRENFTAALGERIEISPVPHSDASARLCERLSDVLYASSAAESSVFIGKKTGDVTLLHAVDFGEGTPPPREFTWFFRDKKPRLLGYYSVEYEDGLVYSYPIEYGYNIGDLKCDFAPLEQERLVKTVEDESGIEVKGELTQPAAICEFSDKWVDGVSAFADAYPVKIKDKTRTVYATTLKNRRPDVPLKEIKFYLPAKKEDHSLSYRSKVVLCGVFAK